MFLSKTLTLISSDLVNFLQQTKAICHLYICEFSSYLCKDEPNTSVILSCFEITNYGANEIAKC